VPGAGGGIVSPGVRRVLPCGDPGVLRELAALIESRDRSRRTRMELTPAALEELADMVLAGTRPTVGWWRKQLSPERRARLGRIEGRER
jgi:hypothetical protein